MSQSADFQRLAEEIEAGLIAYMTDPHVSNPPGGRAVAIEIILRDWLTAHRYMKKVSERTPVRLDRKAVDREEVQYPGFIR